MTEHQISVTLKAGKDFDSPWVVIYGDNPSEVEDKLANIEGVLKQTVSTAAVLRSLHSLEVGGLPATPTQPAQQAAQPAPSGWGQPQQQAAPAQPAVPQVQLHPEGKTCQCGRTLEYKKVTRKSDNKTFEFWSCPAQQKRDDGHHSEFAN